MRIATLGFVLLGAVVCAGSAQAGRAGAVTYDADLAKRLGADERGMKMYVLVILKTGPKADFPKDERAKIFAGHMDNLKQLAREGKLVIAGPFEDNAQHYEGIFIFNVAKIADAAALLATDPAVAAGALAYDAFGWYGSAALQEVTAIHGRIEKPGH